MTSTTSAEADFEAAITAFDAGQLAPARLAIRRAVAGFRRVDGPHAPDTANARVEYARILLACGEPAKASAELDHATSALARIRDRGQLTPLRADAWLLAARAARELGRYDDARRAGQQALRHARRAGDRLVAHAHNELGVIAKFAGAFAAAERHYRAAMPLVRALYGARSRAMATLWHNLGGLAHARGQFARGEPLARRAVELLPASDPERVEHEVAHAALLDGLGRHREAIVVYRRALAAYRRRFGPVHYEIAATLQNLAASQHALGQHAAARRHYRDALALQRRLLGTTHPDVAATLHNLGVLEAATGARAKARELLRRALAISTARLGRRHPRTRATARALGRG